MKITQFQNKIKNVKLGMISLEKVLIFTVNNTEYYYKNSFFTTNKKEDLIRFFNSIHEIHRKILFLKGVGLKAFINKKERILELKLGFSHVIKIYIENGLSIKIKKTFLIVQSFNKESLGNFVFKIKKKFMPDSYKGKGIWYKSEKKKLKIVKKK